MNPNSPVIDELLGAAKEAYRARYVTAVSAPVRAMPYGVCIAFDHSDTADDTTNAQPGDGLALEHIDEIDKRLPGFFVHSAAAAPTAAYRHGFDQLFAHREPCVMLPGQCCSDVVVDSPLHAANFKTVSSLSLDKLYQVPVYHSPVATFLDGTTALTSPMCMILAKVNSATNASSLVNFRAEITTDGEFPRMEGGLLVASTMYAFSEFFEMFAALGGNSAAVSTLYPETTTTQARIGELPMITIPKSLRDALVEAFPPVVNKILAENKALFEVLVEGEWSGVDERSRSETAASFVEAIFGTEVFEAEEPYASLKLPFHDPLKNEEYAKCVVAPTVLFRALMYVYNTVVRAHQEIRAPGNYVGNYHQVFGMCRVVDAVSAVYTELVARLNATERLYGKAMSNLGIDTPLASTLCRVVDDAKQHINRLLMLRAFYFPVLYEVSRAVLFSFSGLYYGNTHNFMVGVAWDYNKATLDGKVIEPNRNTAKREIMRGAVKRMTDGKIRIRAQMAYAMVPPAMRTDMRSGVPSVPAAICNMRLGPGGVGAAKGTFWPSMLPQSEFTYKAATLFYDFHYLTRRHLDTKTPVQTYTYTTTVLWMGMHYSLLHAAGNWSRLCPSMPAATPNPIFAKNPAPAIEHASQSTLLYTTTELPYMYVPLVYEGSIVDLPHLYQAVKQASRELVGHYSLGCNLLREELQIQNYTARDQLPQPETDWPLASTDPTPETDGPARPILYTATGSLDLQELRRQFCARTLSSIKEDIVTFKDIDPIREVNAHWIYLATTRQVIDYWRQHQCLPALSPYAITFNNYIPVDAISPWIREMIRANFELSDPHLPMANYSPEKGMTLKQFPPSNMSPFNVARYIINGNNSYLTANPFFDLRDANSARPKVAQFLARIVMEELGIHPTLYVGRPGAAKKRRRHPSKPTPKRSCAAAADDGDVSSSSSSSSSSAPHEEQEEGPDEDEEVLETSPILVARYTLPTSYFRMHAYRLKRDSPLATLSKIGLDQGRVLATSTTRCLIMGGTTQSEPSLLLQRDSWRAHQAQLCKALPWYRNVMGAHLDGIVEPNADAADAEL